jgi:hypothetical protein
MNGLSATLFYLEGRVAALQAERDTAFLRLDQLRSAQRDAHEYGHRWPGPEPEALEAALVNYRNARLDLEEARGDQARFLGDLNSARAELQTMRLKLKREQRNRPLTSRPFAALLS